MLTGDKFFEGAIPEIDDVHHADRLLSHIRGADPEARVLRAAKLLAGLREYYVQIGREAQLIETTKNAAPEKKQRLDF